MSIKGCSTPKPFCKTTIGESLIFPLIACEIFSLPNDLFGKFPEVGTVEIHLASGFLNIVYTTLPEELRERIYQYLREKYAEEKEEGWTDEQFIYKLRKKAVGQFNKELWLISEPDKEVIRHALAEELEILFQKLNIIGTAHTIRKYLGSNF